MHWECAIMSVLCLTASLLGIIFYLVLPESDIPEASGSQSLFQFPGAAHLRLHGWRTAHDGPSNPGERGTRSQ